MTCSVVIPVHNEAEDLRRFLLRFWDELQDLQRQVREIHLVENGSTDGTYEAARSLANEIGGVIHVHRQQKASYGEAIRHGILVATGDAVALLECDVLDADFVRRSLTCIERDEAEVVVGSKRHPLSVDRRPLKRRVLTYLFNMYLKLRLGFRGTDTHGLKTMRLEVAQRLARLCVTSSEVLQTELVLLAEKLDYRVAELPFQLVERRSTPVSIRKRFPLVVKIIRELRSSLSRFPTRGGDG